MLKSENCMARMVFRDLPRSKSRAERPGRFGGRRLGLEAFCPQGRLRCGQLRDGHAEGRAADVVHLNLIIAQQFWAELKDDLYGIVRGILYYPKRVQV